MSSNSKRTSKTKRKRTSESAIEKSKKTKRRKKKSTAEKVQEFNEVIDQIEDSVEKGEVVESEVVRCSLITREELEKITRENSFILNPLLANASIQKDLEMAAMRSSDLPKLHKYLFDPVNQATFDDKTLVNLYSIAVKDHHAQMAIKVKIAEMSDKARLIKETGKMYLEREKQREIDSEDTSHTSEIIQALLSESMQHAIDDEINKKWGGSNSYRPPENKHYDIIAIDPNAEED